jgi:hypothetical protein
MVPAKAESASPENPTQPISCSNIGESILKVSALSQLTRLAASLGALLLVCGFIYVGHEWGLSIMESLGAAAMAGTVAAGIAYRFSTGSPRAGGRDDDESADRRHAWDEDPQHQPLRIEEP